MLVCGVLLWVNTQKAYAKINRPTVREIFLLYSHLYYKNNSRIKQFHEFTRSNKSKGAPVRWCTSDEPDRAGITHGSITISHRKSIAEVFYELSRCLYKLPSLCRHT